MHSRINSDMSTIAIVTISFYIGINILKNEIF